ncbi:MAG: DUF4177 domain-containing protein [Clostridia bacterium]|nr:DUF4177 domain-containing protein [Clostridia bacterium]
MKHYEYVNVKLDTHMLSYDLTQHKEIIDRYARMGYRYVGFVPTKIVGYGCIREIDLIFECDA